jgi:hypothetical protein
MANNNKAKWAAYMREYTRRNRERINAKRRSRRTAATLAREKAWKKANRAKVLQYKKRDREKRPKDYARWKRAWHERNLAKTFNSPTSNATDAGELLGQPKPD